MNDNINEWVGRAKASEHTPANKQNGVKVIRKENQSRGSMIIEIAEKIKPVIQNFFRDRRNKDGMLYQPAHIRAFALNYAEFLVKAEEQDNNAATA